MVETLLFAIGLNALGFLIAFKFKTDKLTDISYALSFAGIAIYGALTNTMSVVQWCVLAIVLVWSARLGSFLLYRVHVVGRDQRFDEMRKSFWLFGRFWILQGLTAWIVMLPATYLFQSQRVTELNTLTITGLTLAVFGIMFEAIADWQKFQFNQNPKNKGHWIESGIWRYSRHPNYFGEITTWIGVYIACVSWLNGSAVLIAAISPLTIMTLLIGFSGIPILEKSADKRWGDDKKYRAYKNRTSILIPLPRR